MFAPGMSLYRLARTHLSWILVLATLPALAHAVQFNPVPSPFVAVSAGRAEWGDYDGDGDLDLAMGGATNAGWSLKIYENLHESAPGTFQLHATLEGLDQPAVAWGDYDADGDLDLAAGGWNGIGMVTRIYRNTGGVFADIAPGMVGISLGDLDWGDFDNDGDLDLLEVGGTGVVNNARIYRNTGAGFVDTGTVLPGLYSAACAWGDYDADGDLDFAIAGETGPSTRITRIYRNDPAGFVDTGTVIPGTNRPGLAWGDYNHDGDLDLLMYGGTLGLGAITRIYDYNAGAFTDIGAGLLGLYAGSLSWADIENDGDLDILMTGYIGVDVTRVYENTGAGFSLLNLGLLELNNSDAAWGDYDRDHDLDLLLTGMVGNTRTLQLYESSGAPANTPPASPGNPVANAANDPVLLSWTAPIDGTTPSNQLSYNLRISTTPLGVNLKAPMSNPTTGLRRVVRLGNVHGVTTWPFDRPAAPGMYYWSVQAVDAAYEASPWSVEGTFSVGSVYTIVAGAGPHGTIAPSGVVPVVQGASQTFTMTPDACYRIVDVQVDNVSQGPVSSYTFSNVNANHTITALFGNGSAAAPERLQAWWTFDDMAGPKMRDLAHYNSGVNAGSLTGGAAVAPGLVGNALRCLATGDGMQVVATGNSLFFGSRGFAMDAWIYLNAGSAPSHARAIASSPSFRFWVQGGILFASVGASTFTAGGAPLSEDTWHHVAVTIYPDLHLGRFYVDGAPRGSNFNPPNGSSLSSLVIGAGMGAAFNGLIDEVDVFRASLGGVAVDGPVMQRIWSAGCDGKRREFVRLPLHTTQCPVCAVFSNYTAAQQTYTWQLSALHAPLCGGTPNFNPGGGGLIVAAGGTNSVSTAITGSGCFRLNAVNQGSGNTFFTEGWVSGVSPCPSPRPACLMPARPAPGAEAMTSTAGFMLYNEGEAPRSIPCRIEAIDGDTGDPIEFVRLNDLDWGEAVEQTVDIAPGDSVELSVTVQVDTNNPFLTDQILLSADLDGDATLEPVVSSLVEAFEDSTGATVAAIGDPIDPRATSARVRVSPNPFRGWTSVAFTLAESRDVEVSVFDVAGRRVRTLHSGTLAAGPHAFAWDGRASGIDAESGVYFIRVESNGLNLVSKAVQLR